MKKDKKRSYEKPSITLVSLNPAQAVLSVCSTTGVNNSSSGSGNRCRASNCKKMGNVGDSMGQS